MSISIKKYVDITSGVGAGAAVKERELILRLFTDNSAVPAGQVLEMTELNDVATKFGTDSEEYKRAAKYFGFVSKIVTKAKKISFSYFSTSGAAVPPSISGGTPGETVIANWKAILDGALSVKVGTADYVVSGIDFSGASTLADVASTIATELNGVTTPTGTISVSFDQTSSKFNAIFNGITPPVSITVTPVTGSGTDLSGKLGWTVAAGMATGAGSAATTPLEYVIEADEISDNYGSFAFCGTPLDHDTVQAIAEWNNAQNVKYMYLAGVTIANWDTWYGTLQTYAGLALTIVGDPNSEFDELIPGIILGATDYNQRNASQNYMFQQVAGITPKVDDNTLANMVDNDTRVNYYGRTKNAGQPIDFYQNGYLCGTSTAPLQMNVYANEQWFKAAATAQMMSLLLNLPIIPATEEGRSIVLAGLQDCVDRALFNGTIKAEKDLTIDQKAYVTQITGDVLAWHQVQGIGYWLDAAVKQEAQNNGTTKYIVDYTLIYSKADAVNKITGRDILI